MNVIENLATYEDQISPGISACVGCNVELTLRTCMKVMGPNTIFAVPPGCMGGVGVVGWDKKSGAKCPVFFPLLDNVASMLASINCLFTFLGWHDLYEYRLPAQRLHHEGVLDLHHPRYQRPWR